MLSPVKSIQVGCMLLLYKQDIVYMWNVIRELKNLILNLYVIVFTTQGRVLEKANQKKKRQTTPLLFMLCLYSVWGYPSNQHGDDNLLRVAVHMLTGAGRFQHITSVSPGIALAPDTLPCPIQGIDFNLPHLMWFGTGELKEPSSSLPSNLAVTLCW